MAKNRIYVDDMSDNEDITEPETVIDAAVDETTDEIIDDAAVSKAQPPSEDSDPKIIDDATKQIGSDADEFDKPVRANPADDVDIDALIVNIDGYEGPLDVLLDLARTQKVDLRKISILPLVEQYLAFVEAAKARRLELAADYLVMASWLTFLKTKLLLPAIAESEEEPTADEMAARLAFQLQRLEAMRSACDNVFKLPQRGIEFFPRGAPTGVSVEKKTLWKAELFDLLKAYAKQRVAGTERTYQIKPPSVYSIEDARKRLSRVLGRIPDWVDLSGLALEDAPEAPRRSVIASAFNAALEFAKDGKMEIRQLGHYEPLYVRQRSVPRSDEVAAVPHAE